MFVQNHVHYNMLFKKSPYGVVVLVKNLIPQCASEEFKSPHLQPRLLWLLK